MLSPNAVFQTGVGRIGYLFDGFGLDSGGFEILRFYGSKKLLVLRPKRLKTKNVPKPRF